MVLKRTLNLQVRQVILNLLRAELPETRALSTLHTFDAEKMVRRGADNTC